MGRGEVELGSELTMTDHGGKDGHAPEFPSRRFMQIFRAQSRYIWPAAVSIFLAISVSNLKSWVEGIELLSLLYQLQSWTVTMDAITIAAGVLLSLLAVFLLIPKRTRPVYMLEFSDYKPPDCLKVNYATFQRGSVHSGKFNQDSLEFQERLAARAGLGESTYLPIGLFKLPNDINMNSAREEAEMVMFGCIRDLLEKTGLKPRDIGILVVNCSLFNPTPSLSAMIINHFKMRSDIISYNLSGMGCSAGVIALDLARELLQVHQDRYAIVMSTENITQNWYFGNERSMLIPNVLFRMGGAAILLTNKQSERPRAKYSLSHVIRVNLAAENDAFRCVYQKQDSDGEVGVELQKTLMKVAGRALTRNMTRMGPLVLPVSEKIFFVLNLFAIKLFGMKVQTYTPDFTQAFDHFCLHAGGRAVIEGMGKQLNLPKHKTEPSFQTLEWYGNTSSSSVWYSLGYIETVQGVKKDDIVWQLAFGSGFKCNSAVWRALKDNKQVHKAWAHKITPHFSL